MLITVVVTFLARPVSVLIALLPVKMSIQEKLFVGWVGLRGAVPIVLATFPLLAGVAKADFLFDLVFFIVLVSVLLQGTTAPFVARWLGVIIPAPTEQEAQASVKQGLIWRASPAAERTYFSPLRLRDAKQGWMLHDAGWH